MGIAEERDGGKAKKTGLKLYHFVLQVGLGVYVAGRGVGGFSGGWAGCDGVLTRPVSASLPVSYMNS